MKTKQHLLTLEELWAIEAKHPFSAGNPKSLLAWADGILGDEGKALAREAALRQRLSGGAHGQPPPRAEHTLGRRLKRIKN